jgi:hypothetical protein
MHRFLFYLTISLLLACAPTDGAFARGGNGGHGGGSHSSGSLRGSGYVNPSYHYVRPYYRRDGTYIPGHYQTNPNDTKLDNYSTEGNVNPHTGKPGWIRPDETSRTYYPLQEVPISSAQRPREVPISNYQPREVPISSAVPVPPGPTSKSVTVERPGKTKSRRSVAVSPDPDEGELDPVPVANPYYRQWTVRP